jgi:hypothetical protein
MLQLKSCPPVKQAKILEDLTQPLFEPAIFFNFHNVGLCIILSPAKVTVLSIVVSLPSTVITFWSSVVIRLKQSFIIGITASLPMLAAAQTDTASINQSGLTGDSSINAAGVALQAKFSDPIDNGQQLYLSPQEKKKRIITNSSVHAGLYAGSMLLLNQAWYANYPRSSFHFFDDNGEWLQVDKAGHAWTAYQISRTSMASWKWAGLTPNQQAWYGGLAGIVFQTVIEIQDGFSAEWGWSWGDFTANCLGSALMVGQQLGWREQRISYKFSFHRKTYDDPMLNDRSDSLFGSSVPERTLKDYNGQTYWLSANLKSFFPKSKLPAWLNISIGYGADGMFGATENKWETSDGTTVDRTDIQRVRQWYLAPDIDFTRIPTKSKFLKAVFFCLNAFKMPAPTLVLSNGKLVVHGFYF